MLDVLLVFRITSFSLHEAMYACAYNCTAKYKAYPVPCSPPRNKYSKAQKNCSSAMIAPFYTRCASWPKFYSGTWNANLNFQNLKDYVYALNVFTPYCLKKPTAAVLVRPLRCSNDGSLPTRPVSHSCMKRCSIRGIRVMESHYVLFLRFQPHNSFCAAKRGLTNGNTLYSL